MGPMAWYLMTMMSLFPNTQRRSWVEEWFAPKPQTFTESVVEKIVGTMWIFVSLLLCLVVFTVANFKAPSENEASHCRTNSNPQPDEERCSNKSNQQPFEQELEQNTSNGNEPALQETIKSVATTFASRAALVVAVVYLLWWFFWEKLFPPPKPTWDLVVARSMGAAYATSVLAWLAVKGTAASLVPVAMSWTGVITSAGTVHGALTVALQGFASVSIFPPFMFVGAVSAIMFAGYLWAM